MARVEAEVVERSYSAGAYVCRKDDPVGYWNSIGFNRFLLMQLNERSDLFILLVE